MRGRRSVPPALEVLLPSSDWVPADLRQRWLDQAATWAEGRCSPRTWVWWSLLQRETPHDDLPGAARLREVLESGHTTADPQARHALLVPAALLHAWPMVAGALPGDADVLSDPTRRDRFLAVQLPGSVPLGRAGDWEAVRVLAELDQLAARADRLTRRLRPRLPDDLRARTEAIWHTGRCLVAVPDSGVRDLLLLAPQAWPHRRTTGVQPSWLAVVPAALAAGLRAPSVALDEPLDDTSFDTVATLWSSPHYLGQLDRCLAATRALVGRSGCSSHEP